MFSTIVFMNRFLMCYVKQPLVLMCLFLIYLNIVYALALGKMIAVSR